jgi:hypothetical protein
VARLLLPEPQAAAPDRPREVSWNGYASAPSSLALAIENEAERGVRRPPSDRWCRSCERRFDPPPDGFEALIRYTDGSVFVATFLARTECSLEVRISGSGERRSIPIADVSGLTPVLCAHTHHDRALVMDRQRRGEPGARLAPAPPMSAPRMRDPYSADRKFEIARARLMLQQSPNASVSEIASATGLGASVVRQLRAALGSAHAAE